MQENSLEPLLKPLVRNMKGRHIAIGPICWLPKDGLKDKIWYFRTAVCDRRRGFVSDEVCGETGPTSTRCVILPDGSDGAQAAVDHSQV
jgi:hypothetical protein